jgi:lycopene cyclase domain-containing protein
MTYFGFLAIFLVIPILILGVMIRNIYMHPSTTNRLLPLWAIGLHMIIAVLYTTPWDNYLVATRVWWYDPSLVTGIVLGWVPLEEYTFFILQPILVGLWLAYWISRYKANNVEKPLVVKSKRNLLGFTVMVWLISVWILFSRWMPGKYLGLELVWALPPMMLQIAFGGDILRRYWRLVITGIGFPTIYLSAADALAIGWGTWTINPEQSTGLLIGNLLPIEEFLFFLLTNSLVSLGLILVWAPESQERIARLRQLLPRKSVHSDK